MKMSIVEPRELRKTKIHINNYPLHTQNAELIWMKCKCPILNIHTNENQIINDGVNVRGSKT